MQAVSGKAQGFAKRSEVFFDQAGVETVVAGGNGRVRGEDDFAGNCAERRLSKVMPSSSMRMRIASSTAKALWPSFR